MNSIQEIQGGDNNETNFLDKVKLSEKMFVHHLELYLFSFQF